MGTADVTSATAGLREIVPPEMFANNADWSPSGDLMAWVRVDGSDLEPATSSAPMFGWHPRIRPTGV